MAIKVRGALFFVDAAAGCGSKKLPPQPRSPPSFPAELSVVHIFSSFAWGALCVDLCAR
jgi:hypothetical protein